jgi:hypothetical protein
LVKEVLMTELFLEVFEWFFGIIEYKRIGFVIGLLLLLIANGSLKPAELAR